MRRRDAVIGPASDELRKRPGKDTGRTACMAPGADLRHIHILRFGIRAALGEKAGRIPGKRRSFLRGATCDSGFSALHRLYGEFRGKADDQHPVVDHQGGRPQKQDASQLHHRLQGRADLQVRPVGAAWLQKGAAAPGGRQEGPRDAHGLQRGGVTPV